MRSKKNTASKSGFRTFIKVVGIINFIIILLILGIGIGGYSYLKSSLGKMQQVELKKEDIEVNEGVEKNLEGYRTIAQFGH